MSTLTKNRISHLRIYEVSATASPINQKAFIKTAKKINKKSLEKEMETVMKKSETTSDIDIKSQVVPTELLKSQEIEIQQLVAINKAKEDEIRLLKSMVADGKYGDTIEASIPNVLKITKSAANLIEPLNYLRNNNTQAYEALLKSLTRVEQVVQLNVDAVSAELPRPEYEHMSKSMNPVDDAFEILKKSQAEVF